MRRAAETSENPRIAPNHPAAWQRNGSGFRSAFVDVECGLNSASLRILRPEQRGLSQGRLGDGSSLSGKFIGEVERGDEGAFTSMTRQNADALIVFGGAPFSTRAQGDKLVELAAKTRLPTMFRGRGYVDARGLLSYGSRDLPRWRLVASYVDKILKGAKPADLPVQQPTEFELVINLKTAKALGLTIPPSVLLRATEVIE